MKLLKINNHYIIYLFTILLVITNSLIVSAKPSFLKRDRISSSILTVNPKVQACGKIGCPGGKKKCGNITIHVNIGFEGTGVGAKVTYDCYQPLHFNVPEKK